MPDCNNSRDIHISSHAIEAWKQRAERLGIDPTVESLVDVFKKSKRERPQNKKARWELTKRNILNGGQYYVAYGWRFVVDHGVLVTVERVNPNENFHAVDIFGRNTRRPVVVTQADCETFEIQARGDNAMRSDCVKGGRASAQSASIKSKN